jgi:hypothetical protein
MTVDYQIVYWRDIPAQVRVRDESGKRVSRPLAHRFQVAIDEAAMRAGATGAEAYLDDWRTTEWQQRPGERDEALAALVSELETQYDSGAVRALVANGGHAPGA